MKRFLLSIVGAVAAASCLIWAFRSFQPQYPHSVHPGAAHVSPTDVDVLGAADVSSTDVVVEEDADASAFQKLQEEIQSLKDENSNLKDVIAQLEEKICKLSATLSELPILMDENGDVVTSPPDGSNDEVARDKTEYIDNTARFALSAADSGTMNSTSVTSFSPTELKGVNHNAPVKTGLAALIGFLVRSTGQIEPNWAKIYKDVKGGCVYFFHKRLNAVPEKEKESVGTGYVLARSERFFLVTDKHVLDVFDGLPFDEMSIETIKGNRISQFEDSFCIYWIDLAVFEVSRETLEKYPEIVVLEPDESDNLDVFEEFCTMGNVPGYPGHTLKGSISGDSRWDREAKDAPFCRYIGLNADIIRGMSGAPLINGRGKVFATVKSSLENLFKLCGNEFYVGVGKAYATPMAVTLAAIDNRIDYPGWVYSYLGAEFGDVLNETDGVEDVQITKVVPGSPAAAAGLRAGDQIVSFNGEAPQDYREMEFLVAIARPGEAQIDVRRDGEILNKTAVLTYCRAK